MLPRAWERLSVSFCPVLNVAPAIRQSALFISTFKGEVNGWCKFGLLCNDLCWSFLVIFISWLTCKLPNSQRQHWHAVNGCIWPAAVLTASGKAHPGCRMPRAPESDWAPSSDSGGCKEGHAPAGKSRKGARVLGPHCSGSILIEKIEHQTGRQTCFPDRCWDKDRQTDLPSYTFPATHVRNHCMYQWGCWGLNIRD